jgi:hypothetical protein
VFSRRGFRLPAAILGLRSTTFDEPLFDLRPKGAGLFLDLREPIEKHFQLRRS